MRRSVFWGIDGLLIVVAVLSGVLLAFRPVRVHGDIHKAAREGDIARAHEILAAWPRRVNVRDENDWTPLHCAVYSREIEVARLLLAKGARTNVKAKLGPTPLHFAAGWGDADLTNLLLANGADVNARGPVGRTPLHEAVFHAHKHVAELLLTKGADVNAKANDGKTLLHLAKEMPQRKHLVELLKQHGAKE